MLAFLAKGLGRLLPIFGLLASLSLTPSLHAAGWSPSTSDENGENSPAICENSMVSGMSCSGRYCDNIALRCGDDVEKGDSRWTGYYSEEQPAGVICEADEMVDSIRTSGKYSDNYSIRCTRSPQARGESCSWMPKFSDENGGTIDFGEGNYVRGLRSSGRYSDNLEAYVCRSSQAEFCTSDSCKIDQAKRFAPVLKFDQAQALPNKCFPSDAEDYWNARKSGNSGRICNEDPNSLSGGQIPIYYQYQDCSRDSTVIVYWFFYGYQDTCMMNMGSHNADWERIAVRIRGGKLERVMYFQHGGQYTKHANEVELQDGRHPVVFVGKNSHGSYHDRGGSGSCLYFEDYRNPSDKNLTLQSRENLVELVDKPWSPEWMTSRDSTNFDGIPGPIARNINLCAMEGCAGKDFQIGSAMCFGQCGCSKSSIGDSLF